MKAASLFILQTSLGKEGSSMLLELEVIIWLSFLYVVLLRVTEKQKHSLPTQAMAIWSFIDGNKYPRMNCICTDQSVRTQGMQKT